MENAEHADAHWQRFRSQPAAFAHARRVVFAFDGLIGEEIAGKLCDDERFRDRLSALLTERYALGDDFGDGQPSAAGRWLGLATSAELAGALRRFGAIYWARAIAGVIEARAVVALQQQLGDEAYAAALAHRDLSAAVGEVPAAEDLDEAVTSAGLRCLAAWCARQPAAIAQRIRLKLANDSVLDDPVVAPFDELGPRIVDRVVA